MEYLKLIRGEIIDLIFDSNYVVTAFSAKKNQ